jgi:hypothetical protein
MTDDDAETFCTYGPLGGGCAPLTALSRDLAASDTASTPRLAPRSASFLKRLRK